MSGIRTTINGESVERAIALALLIQGDPEVLMNLSLVAQGGGGHAVKAQALADELERSAATLIDWPRVASEMLFAAKDAHLV